jgi:uncharacterized protein YuzE
VVSQELLSWLRRAVRRFELADISIADLQSSILSNGSALDGSMSELADVIRQVESELEHIQHAVLLEEQRGAAIEALGPLLRGLERVGASPRREVPEGERRLRLEHDQESDSVYVYLGEAIPHGTVSRAIECGPVVLDFDRLDRLVGIEIRSASDSLPLSFDD